MAAYEFIPTGTRVESDGNLPAALFRPAGAAQAAKPAPVGDGAKPEKPARRKAAKKEA